MNYLITESQIENLVFRYLDNMFGVKEYRTDKYPTILFFIRDGKIYMEYDIENDVLYMGYRVKYSIERSLENMFDLNRIEINKVMNEWLEQVIGKKIKTRRFTESLPQTMNFE
jgi:hypothetical protein